MHKNILEIQKSILQKQKEKERKSNFYSNMRLIIFILSLVEMIIYFNTRSTLHIALTVVLICFFIIMVIIHHQIDKEIDRFKNLLSIIEKYSNRIDEKWKEETYTINESKENFIGDLDIIGKNSLMQFLDFTSSLGGKRKLIKTLSLENVSQKKIQDNQGSIEELKTNFNFCLNFKERLDKIENIENIDFKELFSLFDKSIQAKSFHLIISIILSASTILSLILSILKMVNPALFLVLFFLQLAISYIYSIRYNEFFEDIGNSSRIFSKLMESFNYVDSFKFKDSQNQKLKTEISLGKSIIKDLSSIRELDLFRTNFITNVLLNVFFSLNFILLYKYSKLLSTHTENFKTSIKALEQFEVLISLTTICFVKNNICLPIIEDDLKLNIADMRHPLIEEEKCVTNSFSCNRDINIITGSNMSGKTSFMRTIGINLILAYSGTYVNSTSFSCPIMKIFTSINVKDDIANGISTFYGELKRIKDILDYSENHNDAMIVFIDEIFKGTNYNDRILGAKETLKSLAGLNCIVFLTTHDFELCEIKSKTIYNYHFRETYKDNKINFDYKIKEGQCKTTNAKYLMEQMGIIKTKHKA